jgi:hypothetical protein
MKTGFELKLESAKGENLESWLEQNKARRFISSKKNDNIL